MTTLVELTRDGEVAVILVDNPPVNALSHAVRSGLLQNLKAAQEDAGIEAVVIACKGRTFIAGADITEFGKPFQPPGLLEVIAFMDEMSKPIVAAIHGTALGGGLEVALGAHWRVAAESARLGLPEVKLGILPGAGGTQRLPRLVGAEEALKMIVSGDPIAAPKALQLGLVDEISKGDIVADGVAFARKILAEGRPIQRVRDRADKLAFDEKAFKEAAGNLTKRARGLEAPMACVTSVHNALTMPFDEGIGAERDLFMKLVAGDQSKAQRHVFFAEREALKVPDMPATTKARDVAKAAVIGGGTMGGGIAMCFANVGVPVTLIETNDEALQRGLGIIAGNYRATAAKGGLAPEQAEKRIGLIKGAVGLDAAADADLVIEAVFENMDLKKQIFADLDRIAKPGAVLATNTSTLDVDEIARATSRPADVVGMHFFSPANVMKLLETVRGRATSHEALKTAVETGRRIGKTGVISGVCFGFIGNRMLGRRTVEAERVILEGALPQEVDQAIVEFGFPMGPFAMGDLAGLDVGWRVRQGTGAKAEIADQLYELGRHGQKTGKGYFLYEDGSRVPRPDPEVEAMILASSKRLGIERRAISKQEIIERMVYPMINEGARILDEGIAMRPGDIDITWVYGYGWPVWRGGPMFYADQVGLTQIADRLAHYAETVGDETLTPAPLLVRLANEGKGFGSLAARG
ncbi:MULTISPECIES: 3-hydroxyacyl-CoA dehydrogenase NAD-binding domain-containing protein [Rhodomicrobium]|uniref:3-hydroxyacyl-CoA dehydrogenase NAD-binding domain-containing protein n=1 Tax=Rhodomicrobium TaxID=1068 RepID=UPI000B4B17D5|nr:MULTISPECIES: 3-hydroxyacyl-CoA dehydrogenase NAD-binding domain-containing protein [Rhodomicrobium]